MILITGASGTVGSAVLKEVVKSGKPIRAMYRSKDAAAKVPAGATAAVADFADKQSLLSVLKGVDTVFLVCSPVRELVQLESNVIEACRDAGVRHIVLNSALGAGDYPKSFPSWHRKVEDKLKASGINHTILRPNGFMQNILAYFAPTIRAQGAFYQSTGTAKISHIDVHDVAAVAAKALFSPSDHSNQTYELNGPEALSHADIAERISKVAGRKIQYVDIPIESQRKSLLDLGMAEWQVGALLELQEYYAAGKCAATNNLVARLLGRAPITLDSFLAENAGSFREQAAKA